MSNVASTLLLVWTGPKPTNRVGDNLAGYYYCTALTSNKYAKNVSKIVNDYKTIQIA